MAGIYLHIPFCKKACLYCNFHFSTSLQLKDELIKALLQEIVMQKNYLPAPIETIYFGGGTPSILTEKEIAAILKTLGENYRFANNMEITLEANPDDITKEKILGWKNAGINRLSIGVQSFIEADLLWMNRAHDKQQAMTCAAMAVANGITNLSIDLIYGTPGLSNTDWVKNIEMANSLGIQHLSCYALTVEPNTALEKIIFKKNKAPVDADKAAEQFEILMQTAPAFEFEHYEISNLAKPGYRSKHNASYWQGKPYLGIGPSAHSYNGIIRQWNIANNALYIKCIQQATIPFEAETLTAKQKCNEYIMTSLRTIEGLDIKVAEKDFGYPILKEAEKFIQQELMQLQNNFLQLTNAGKLRADGIASALFL
jgi:oxygen-independent coproporphyrinogen-3 oxidase